MKKLVNTMIVLMISGVLFAVDNTATIQIRVTSVSDSKTDYISLLENPGYSEAFVQGEDSKKMSISSATNVYIYTNVGSEICAVKGTNNLYGTEIIVKTNSSTRYKFTVPYQAGKQYYLYDVDSVKLTPLLSTSSYECDMPAGQSVTERFYIMELSQHPRSVANGNWGTVCFPYKIVAAEGANLYEFAGINTAKTIVYADLVNISDVVAGKAYLFKATGDNGQVFKYAALKPVAVPVANNGLVGVFADSTTVATAWIINGQQILPVAATSLVPQYRAFVPSLDEIQPVGDLPQAPGRKMFNVKGVPTELEEMQNAECTMQSGKVMIDGKLVIIRDGKMFNAQGGRL